MTFCEADCGPFDPDELVDWAEKYGHPEGWAKRAQAAHSRAEQAEHQRDALARALRKIAEFDAFRGGPIAPRGNPTTSYMREVAKEALAALKEAV